MAYTTIDDPSAYFQTTTWTGDGNDDRSITNTGNSDLQPDFVWIKSRGTTNDHLLFNSTVGVGIYLRSNDTNDETTIADTLQAFQSDGIEIGTDSRLNTNTDPVVSWQWKANAGSTSVNNSGSIQSTVQVNQDAGFSIVTYTGTGSGDITVGHGLGAVPKLIIGKVRNQAYSWRVYHASVGNDKTLVLNGNNAAASSNSWGNTTPTSSVFTAGRGGDDNMNYGSGDTIVAYCFAEKQGYSKFGLYTGNGNADGTFVYTGFRPSWVMAKRTNSTGNWMMFDSKRDTFNVMDSYVVAHSNQAEADFPFVDFLSNGFKWRHTSSHANASASTYIYMAFAEHPFVSSTGTPTTAR
jgi:hypothetical protein